MPGFLPLVRLIIAVAVICLSPCASAAAERATLVVDIDSGAVLQAQNALRPAYPASLTKLMTLYLAFQAVRVGRRSRRTTGSARPESGYDYRTGRRRLGAHRDVRKRRSDRCRGGRGRQ